MKKLTADGTIHYDEQKNLDCIGPFMAEVVGRGAPIPLGLLVKEFMQIMNGEKWGCL